MGLAEAEHEGEAVAVAVVVVVGVGVAVVVQLVVGVQVAVAVAVGVGVAVAVAELEAQLVPSSAAAPLHEPANAAKMTESSRAAVPVARPTCPIRCSFSQLLCRD